MPKSPLDDILTETKPRDGDCSVCAGPLVVTLRYPNTDLCARCLCRPSLCPCLKLSSPKTGA